MSPSWTLDQPGTVKVGSGPRPTLRDRRHDEQRGSPYDAKCNVAEIGAVNMGEIAAVRKRCRKETGPHDSSPCVARVKILVVIIIVMRMSPSWDSGRRSQYEM